MKVFEKKMKEFEDFIDSFASGRNHLELLGAYNDWNELKRVVAKIYKLKPFTDPTEETPLKNNTTPWYNRNVNVGNNKKSKTKRAR